MLFEKMRREGYEFSVSPPTILYKKDEKGKTTEPIEKVDIYLDPKYS